MDRTSQFLYDSNMTRPASIPSFNLFGEVGDLPDVIHCESIEARSTLHDWEFAPHRHTRLHQVLAIDEGEGTAMLDGSSHPLGAGSLVNVPPGIVHGYAFAPGTQGLVVTFALEMIDETLRPAEGLRPVLARPALSRGDDSVQSTLRNLASAYTAHDYARAQILRSLGGLLLGQLARLLAAEDRTEPMAEHALLARFRALLDTEFRNHLAVADYARRLAVSPTHLSRLARAATGRPASGLIEDRVIREARRLLAFTNLPVSRIAYELGYDDPAYFSRVFARATGLPPRAFRNKLDG